MDFGELFFESESSPEKPCTVPQPSSYTPKHCPPEWYNNDQSAVTDDTVIIKYRADMNYFKGNYSTALPLYKRLLVILPTTYSQLKREITDSIVRCCIHCDFGEEGLRWGDKLLVSSNQKDHSVWELLGNCHRLFSNDNNHIQEELLCRLKCVLLARHFPNYWIQLYHSYTRLLQYYNTNATIIISTNLLEHTSELFRPYFNKRRTMSSNHEQFELFINLLTTPILSISSEERPIVLKVAADCSLLRADQLLNYSLSRLSTCSTNTMKQIRTLASTNKDCIELKALITEHMQTPFEIEI